MGKTMRNGEEAEAEAEGSPPKKSPRRRDKRPAAAVPLPTVHGTSEPNLTGKTPPKGDEAEESPLKKAPRLMGVGPGASEPNRTGKTLPKGDEAEESPLKKAPRLMGVGPGASNPTGKMLPKEEASDEKRCNCNHVITESALGELSAIEESSPSLNSKDAWNCFGCWREDKLGIVKTRPPERDLLMCVTCCNHLCCGVGSIAYPFGHSRAHALKKKHWFAVLYRDPARGYCFKCNAEVPMPVKFGEAHNEVGLHDTCDIVRRKLLAPSESVGALIAASDEKRCNCNHVITDSAIENIESSLWFRGAWTCCECQDEKSDLLICVTCCDHPCCGAGPIAYQFGHSRAHALKKEHWFAVLYCDPEMGFCFKCNAGVPTAVSRKLLASPPSVGRTDMEINQKVVERAGKVQAESHPSGQSSGRKFKLSNAQGYAIRGLPNLGNTCYMNAVFQCLFVLGKLRGRMLAFDRPKGTLAEVLEKLFIEANSAGDKLNLHEVLKCVQEHREPKFKLGVMEDSHEFLAVLLEILNEDEKIIDSIFGIEMLQTLTCKKCGLSQTRPRFELDFKLDFSSKWHPATSAIGSEADSTQAQRIISKDVVQSPLQIQEAKSVDALTEESMSIEHFLSLYSKEVVEWHCPSCAKDHKEPSASQSESCEQIVRSSNEDYVGDTDTLHYTTLPPVLTLHPNRTSHQKGTYVGIKIRGHVRFTEYLDIEHHLNDPSSVDKVSRRYRLSGVVEHIGKDSLNSGHYIAYVRARRLGNQQEDSSCSTSWFRADDRDITKVSIEEVLEIEAYILFYERVEDDRVEVQNPEDSVSQWEIIESDETANSEDHCSVHEEDFGNSQWCIQLLHSKYVNKERIERLQTILEWVDQFSNLADFIFPAPMSSVVVTAASYIDQLNKIAAMVNQGWHILQRVIPPPDRLVVLSVANEAQARHAVSVWNGLSQPEQYCVKILDHDQIDVVKRVLYQTGARRLLWRYHPDLCVIPIEEEEDGGERW